MRTTHVVVESSNTYILDAESLDFIVSIWHQVSQGDREVTSSICVIHIVRPVLFTLALRGKRNDSQTSIYHNKDQGSTQFCSKQ